MNVRGDSLDRTRNVEKFNPCACAGVFLYRKPRTLVRGVILFLMYLRNCFYLPIHPVFLKADEEPHPTDRESAYGTAPEMKRRENEAEGEHEHAGKYTRG